GLGMYISAFRNIEAAQLEMALQPQKILLFFVFEEIYLYVSFRHPKRSEGSLSQKDSSLRPTDFAQNDAKKKILWTKVFLIILIVSSIGYSLDRFNHRFFMFQWVRDKIVGKKTDDLNPLAKEPHTILFLS